MATWYETGSHYTPEIKEVEVEKSTDKTITTGGRRRNRHSDWHSYFPTFEEAVEHYRTMLRGKIAAAKDELARAEGRLAILERGVPDRSIIVKPRVYPRDIVLK